ncbi:helix-turn-helix domain-containing protein [Capnocytophaga felis]|uniref:helix-turn-helix domain-containing protein n=1 Tax=Capnocytophaga felis TaxID=2267611 RepID=UPI0012D34D1C|nr:helix-turn-helix transcriptional regulator [Capnocytophaga felis]
MRLSQIIYEKISNKNIKISKQLDCQIFKFTIMDIVKNIKEIRLKKSINQELIAEALGVDGSVISNIEKGKRELKVSELAKIAEVLEVDILYLFTYPREFVDKDTVKENYDRISITFEVSADKREHLLKLVTGEKGE